MKDPFFMFDAPAIEAAVIDSYDHLATDQYLTGMERYRRFAQYKVTKGTNGDVTDVEKLPHRPFIQGVNYNTMFGGVKREYEPIEVDLSKIIEYCMSKVPLPSNESFLIRTHQFRTVISRKVAGICVPEGPHRDGVEFVVFVPIARKNITGGETQVMLTKDGPPIFRKELHPGTVLVVRDKDTYHYVTDLALVDGAETGYRDMLFWGCIPWTQNRYGAAHENELVGGAVREY